jgi:hypothetical protein
MDTARILTELRSERDRIDQAIAALEALDGTVKHVAPRSPGRPKKGTPPVSGRRKRMSVAGRKKLSEMMKKRWAERKKAGKSK